MAEREIGVLIIGARGRMGRFTSRLVEESAGLTLAGEVDVGDALEPALRSLSPDVAVDFTTPSVVAGNLRACLRAGVHPVIGTSGLCEEEFAACAADAERLGVGGIVAPNFALGAVLLIELAVRAAEHLRAAEIIEYHHADKIDAPSGTALYTRQRLAEVLGGGAGLPIHSVRLPGLLAHQEVILGGRGERLSLRHDAIDRECFADGLLLAIRRAPRLERLVLGLHHLLFPGAGER